jgi:hypothetical protein
MQYSLDKFRVKLLFPQFEFQNLVEFKLETPQTKIDISPKPRVTPVYLASSFSSMIITSPYLLTRGANGEGLSKQITPLSNLYLEDFIDDNPASLRPYGLDRPSRIFVQTTEASLDLLIGSQIDGKHYAKLSGKPGVFTVNNFDSVLNIKPFSLIDNFPLLVNIDSVNDFSVTGANRVLRAQIKGADDDMTYYYDGKQAKEEQFKKFYQAVIGLLFDAEYPNPGRRSTAPSDPGNIVIEYRLHKPAGERPSITLVPYNRDFYAVWQEGTMEFLVSRNQVNLIFERADEMVYIE